MKQKTFPYPHLRDVLVVGSGIAAGFAAPAFIFKIIKALTEGGFIKDWLGGKMSLLERAKRIAQGGTGVKSLAIFIFISTVILVLLKKAASLLFKFGIGFVAGIALRFAVGSMGLDIPFVNINQTINQTVNTTLNSSS